MRVGILTFHWAYNYGAVLQAYALQQTLIRMGHEVNILDYRPPHLVSRIGPLGFRSGSPVHVFRMKLRFDGFRKNYLNLTRTLRTTKDLRKTVQSYDALIVGSDQVWNQNIIRGDWNYFLAFADGVRRVSYAADFGQPQQMSENRADLSNLLDRFDHIAVRTSLSKEIARTLTSRDVKVVLDPTLLHDFSETTAKVQIAEPYILVYNIWSGVNRQVLASLTRDIAAKSKVPVYCVSWSPDFPMADRQLRSIGPVEWLAYFRRAAFICTDSYHGFLFAIKNRKPFTAVCLNNRASRIVELAERYGLRNSVVSSASDTNSRDVSAIAVDYDHVHKLIEQDAEDSKAFLCGALLMRYEHRGSRFPVEELIT